jgi:hypothetical protein
MPIDVPANVAKGSYYPVKLCHLDPTQPQAVHHDADRAEGHCESGRYRVQFPQKIGRWSKTASTPAASGISETL